jgi:hypothetical protein
MTKERAESSGSGNKEQKEKKEMDCRALSELAMTEVSALRRANSSLDSLGNQAFTLKLRPMRHNTPFKKILSLLAKDIDIDGSLYYLLMPAYSIV